MKGNNIFNMRQLEECIPMELDLHTAFSYCKLAAGEEYRERSLPYNYMLLVLSGEISVCCNEFAGHRFKTDKMVLLLRSSEVVLKAVEKTELVVFYFDTFISPCERHAFKTFLPDVEKAVYTFSPVSIPKQVKIFLKQLVQLQEQHVDCMHFHELKHAEFFILIRRFCSRNEIIELLAPVISVLPDFKMKVLEKYRELGDGRVSDLASLVGMGRKNFDKRFRETFDTSPAKWIEQQKAKKVRLFLMQSGVTIADAMDQFHFNSPSHFNRFSRKNFGKSPGVILKEAKDMKLNL